MDHLMEDDHPDLLLVMDQSFIHHSLKDHQKEEISHNLVLHTHKDHHREETTVSSCF
jgi:hypothetical protein